MEAPPRGFWGEGHGRPTAFWGLRPTALVPSAPGLGAAQFAPSSRFSDGDIVTLGATVTIDTVIVNEAPNYGFHQLLCFPLLGPGRLTSRNLTLPLDASPGLGLWVVAPGDVGHGPPMVVGHGSSRPWL